MSAALRISVAISGGRECLADSPEIALTTSNSAASSIADAGAVRPLPLAGLASSSAHSRAPSSRVHFSTGLRFGALRRRSRSRSSPSSRGRSSPSRWLTWRAPRRATLPHPAVLRGSGGRSSACLMAGRSVPGLLLPRGAADRLAPARAGPDLGPSVRSVRSGRAEPAARGRPVWPARFAGPRAGAAPPLRAPLVLLLPPALPVRDPLPVPLLLPVALRPVAPRVPPLLAGRRSPPPAPPAAD